MHVMPKFCLKPLDQRVWAEQGHWRPSLAHIHIFYIQKNIYIYTCIQIKSTFDINIQLTSGFQVPRNNSD